MLLDNNSYFVSTDKLHIHEEINEKNIKHDRLRTVNNIKYKKYGSISSKILMMLQLF